MFSFSFWSLKCAATAVAVTTAAAHTELTRKKKTKNRHIDWTNLFLNYEILVSLFSPELIRKNDILYKSLRPRTATEK